MSSPVSPPRVLVIGATGCLGRNISAAFQRDGHEVVGVARNVPRTPFPAPIVLLDVAKLPAEDLAARLAAYRPDIVVNAAGGWGATLEELHSAHAELVERLITAISGMPRRPRLVQIGSIHEYGPIPAGQAIDEQRVPSPETDYARTKFAGAEMVLEHTRAGRIDGVVLRLVNMCGPDTHQQGLFRVLVPRLANTPVGERIELSIAEAERDYLDVRDAADAVVRAGTAEGVTGGVFNIGSGTAVPMRTLVSTLTGVAGHDPASIVELPLLNTKRGGEWTMADITSARTVLGWQPRTDLRTSLSDMWVQAREQSTTLA